MLNYFLSLFVSDQVSDAYVNILSIIVFFSINFSFFDMFLFLKKFCSIKYVLLALFTLHNKQKMHINKTCSIIYHILLLFIVNNIYTFYWCAFVGLLHSVNLDIIWWNIHNNTFYWCAFVGLLHSINLDIIWWTLHFIMQCSVLSTIITKCTYFTHCLLYFNYHN
jgi:hypothetical protein